MALETKKSPRHVRERQRPPINPGKMSRQLVTMLLGAVFARAAVSRGMQPFGVAYVASSGHPLPAAVGAFLSYLTGGMEGLVCGAAAVVTLTCRMVLEGTALSRRRSFFPGCAALALLFTKGVVAAAQGMRAVLLLLCETALCLGFSLMLREARDARSPLSLWGKLTAAMGVILAALPVTLWGVLSPGRLAAVFLVLCAGTFGGMASGTAAGAALGACLDLAQGQGPMLALAWCLAGLAAGYGGKKERLPAALMGCAACGLAFLWMLYQPGAREGLLECFLAAALLVVLPCKWLLGLESAFAGAGVGLERSRKPLTGGTVFPGLSDAVAQLGSVMEALLQSARGEQEPQDLGRVYRTACESACRSCKRRDTCWQEGFNDLQRVLADLSGPLRTRHAITPEGLPAWFSAQCLRPQRFCGAINDAYRGALRRQAQQDQARELHRMVGRQYESLGALLEDVARKAGIGPEYDAVLENRVRRVVRAYLPRTKAAVYLNGGRLQIDLPVQTDSAEATGDHSAMLRSLEGALGVRLLPPRSVDSAKGTVLRICQQEALILRTYTAVRKKEGEDVCGDSHSILHTDDGRGILLLSDGMGTGAQAGTMSRRALELVSSFVQSGCGLAESTAAVLPVLAARFEEWGFVTLDLWEISLFTGSATALKYGAAPGILLREGRVTRLDARALPAGLEPMEGEAPTLQLRLREGDRLVLLSDGVWEGTDTEDLLRDCGALEGQALANHLVEAAAHRGSNDDMTVIVADLERA